MPRIRTAAVVVVLGVAFFLFSGLRGTGSKDNSKSGADSEKTLNAVIKGSPQEQPVVETPKVRKISIEYVESDQKHYLVFDNDEKVQFQNKNDLNQILTDSLSVFAEKVEFVSYDEDEYRDVVEDFLKTHNKR